MEANNQLDKLPNELMFYIADIIDSDTKYWDKQKNILFLDTFLYNRTTGFYHSDEEGVLFHYTNTILDENWSITHTVDPNGKVYDISREIFDEDF